MARPPAGNAITTMIWATEEECRSPAALDTHRQVVELQLAKVLDLVTVMSLTRTR